MALNFESLAGNYHHLFNTCVITPAKYPEIDACINKIVANKTRYMAVGAKTGVPWYFIGIIHLMEGGCNFNTHLHNGDPLTKRTVQVPKGYPKTGNPPFTWEASAEDAIRIKKFDSWTNWTPPGMLYQLERYNGFGYRPRGIHSPYLWSYTNHYTKGKFTRDGLFDAGAVSKQVGTAALLRRMAERQLTGAPQTDIISRIKAAAAGVNFDPNHYHTAAESLQKLLNEVGQALRLDGKAGRNTSDALQRTTGSYLKGDPLH